MDLNVALTTSKFICSNDAFLQMNNVPICVVNCSLGLFNFGIDLEREENRFAHLCKNMTKTLYINSSEKYIFIGEDSKNSDTALIEYTEKI